MTFQKKLFFMNFLWVYPWLETLHLGVICMSKDTTGWAECNDFKYNITTQRMLGLLLFFQIGFLFTLYNRCTKNYFIQRAHLCLFTKRAIYIHIQNFINLHNVKHIYSQWFPISNIWWITKFPTSYYITRVYFNLFIYCSVKNPGAWK